MVNGFMIAQPWVQVCLGSARRPHLHSLGLASRNAGWRPGGAVHREEKRMGGVRRVVPLTLGWEDLPRSVSIYGAPEEERLREPVPGVLLLCDGGWLLLDTGFNTALINDPALHRRYHGDPLVQPVLPGPGEPLAEALAGAGIDLADIHAVAVSHLHNDHDGGLKHFAGRVPVHIQRAELSYG